MQSGADSRNSIPKSELALHLFVWAAILAAACLNIGRSIRADDVWSLSAASQSFRDLLAAVHADVHPPLYFLVLKPWVRLLGPSEPAARLLSILFHLAAAGMVFLLGRRLAGRGAGLLCAAIHALAPLAVLSAELVRMYSLAGLLSATALWLWTIAAERPAKPRIWAALMLAVTLGSFTHIWSLCFIAGLGLASIVHFPRRAVKLLAAIAVALLPFALFWLPVLVAQVNNSGDSAAWLKPPSLSSLGELAFLHLGVVPLFLLFFLSGKLRRRTPASPVPPWVPTIYVSTLLPPLLISFWKPFFFSRFTIVALPVLAIGLGCLLSRIKPAPLAASISAVALVFFIGAKEIAPGCDARGAARTLAHSLSDGDIVVFGSLSRSPVDYYLNSLAPRRAWREQSFPSVIDSHPGYEGAHLRASDLTPLRTEALATAETFRQSGARRVYFLAGGRPQIDAPLIDALRQHYVQGPGLLICDRGDYFTRILLFQRPGSTAR